MQIQIDFPKEYDQLLRIYQANNNIKTKAETVIKLVKKQLQAEKDMFIMQNPKNNPDWIKNL